MKRDDTLWKSILEEIFEDFLYFFFPNANELFDLSKGFEYLDKELEQLFPPEQDHYAVRYVDKLVKVFTFSGSEQWILVHIEVQSYNDKYFAQRMFTYFYRIFDKYNKPITAFAIFTDGNKLFTPRVFEQKFLGTNLRYEFNTYKIIQQSEDLLLKNNNPFAQVVLTVLTAITNKNSDDEQIFSIKLELTRRLLSRKIQKDKIRALMNFLRYYIHFENPEMNIKFDKELDEITQNKQTMGIEEFLLDRAEKKGIAKGIEKGAESERLKIVQSLLINTDFDNEKISSLTGFPIQFIEQMRDNQ